MIDANLSPADDNASRRRLSITFDDGFFKGANIACEVLAETGLAATFYVVTGWVEPQRARVGEAYNAGCSHGDWNHWRAVRDLGHEVGSHTFSHINASGKKARLMPWLLDRELRQSKADLEREVPQPLYTISMAWNAATAHSERIVKSCYAACRLGGSDLAYNSLDALDRHSLNSWAPDGDTPIEEIEQAIKAIPDRGWLILQFHSFEDEGWEPISKAKFQTLCRFIKSVEDLKVATVADVMAEAGPV